MGLEKIHDTVVLLEYVPTMMKRLLNKDEGVILNEYIVAGRYPGDLAYEKIGMTEAEEAVLAANRIKAVVKKAGIGGEH